MILQLRGTSGSGKSTVVHTFLRRWPTEVVEARPGARGERPLVYRTQAPGHPAVFCFGSYQTVCGGVDTVGKYSEVVPVLLRKYQPLGHVLFEGMLLSNSYGSVGACLDELRQVGELVIMCYLDTPLEVCLARIQARRLARGNTSPLNPHNTQSKYQQTLSGRRLLESKGFETVTLDHTKAYRQVMRILDYPELRVRG